MKTPAKWQELERHPLSAEYPDINGPAWERFVTGLQKNGILPTANGRPRKIMLYDGKVIDSYQLLRGCIQAEIVPEFEVLELPKGVKIEEWVEAANDNRRHESQEKIEKRADARRERVAFALRDGKSERQIADAEGVSQTTIQQDKKKLTEQGCSVEPPDNKVLSSDGRLRPAKTSTDTPVSVAKPKTLKQAIDDETDDTLTDDNGLEVPPGLAPVFRGAIEFRGILNQLKEIKARARKLADSPAGRGFHLQQFEIDLDNARRTVRFDMPHAICPTCKGQSKTRRANCPCKDSGWFNESNYKLLPLELRA